MTTTQRLGPAGHTCGVRRYSDSRDVVGHVCGKEFKTDEQREARMCASHLAGEKRRQANLAAWEAGQRRAEVLHADREQRMRDLAASTGLTLVGREYPTDGDMLLLIEWARAHSTPLRVNHVITGVPGERTETWGTGRVSRIGLDGDGPPRIFVTWASSPLVEDEVESHEIRRVTS